MKKNSGLGMWIAIGVLIGMLTTRKNAIDDKTEKK